MKLQPVSMSSWVFACLAILIAFFWGVVDSRCPNWCSQRGICSSPTDQGYCICNYGQTEDDCSRRICPSGFDPLTTINNPNRRTIRVETGALGGVFMGKLEVTFAGSSTLFNADATQFDSDMCTQAITRSMKSVKEASCIREKVNEKMKSGSYLITLHSYPTQPYMNNIIYHNGNPSLDMFYCNTSRVDEEEVIGPYCEVTNVVYEHLPVYAECSNHGSCNANATHASCLCEPGFRGIACDDITDNQDINTTSHVGPFFSATMMKVEILGRTESEEFNLFQTKISGKNVTTIRGDRQLIHIGNMEVKGQTVMELPSPSFAPTSPSDYAHDATSTMISRINDAQHVYNKINHYEAETLGQKVFSIDAKGNTLITGSLSVGSNHSLYVDQESGVVGMDRLKVDRYLDVTGVMTVEESITIGSGFALTSGGMTVDVHKHAGTLLELRSREAAFNGTLFELSADCTGDYEEDSAGEIGEGSTGERGMRKSANCSMIRTLNAQKQVTFEVTAQGEVKMSSMHLQSGGIAVEAGGIEVLSGGITVKGGLVVETGKLVMSSEQQVFEVNQIDMKRSTASASSSSETKPFVSIALDTTSSGDAGVESTGEREEGVPVPVAYHGNMIDLSVMKTSISLDSTTSGDNGEDHSKEGEKDKFNFLSFSEKMRDGLGREKEKTLFAIDSQANLVSKGSIHLKQGSKGLRVDDMTKLFGEVKLKQMTLTPRERRSHGSTSGDKGGVAKKYKYEVMIPLSATYVVIGPSASASAATTTTSEGEKEKESVFVSFEGDNNSHEESNTDSSSLSPHQGRFLIITNTHAMNTIGSVRVPGYSTVMFIHNGHGWVDIEALKAPMHTLRNVEVFEANNDLSIGQNITLSVGKLQSYALSKSKNSLLVVGKDGMIMEYGDKLTFTPAKKTTGATGGATGSTGGGVLSTPALRVERILSNVDMKGNELSNTLITQSRVINSEIIANDLTLPSQRNGLAYFNSKGKLLASSSLSLDETSNQLVINNFYEDVNVNHHTLSHAKIEDSELAGIKTATVNKLILVDMIEREKEKGNVGVTGESGSNDGSDALHTKDYILTKKPAGSMLYIGYDGSLSTTSKEMMYYDTRKGLVVPVLEIERLIGELDASDVSIQQLHVTGGSIENMKKVTSDSMTVHKMRYTSVSSQDQPINRDNREREGGGGRGGMTERERERLLQHRRVVVVDENGELAAYNGGDRGGATGERGVVGEREASLFIPSLLVDSLSFTSDTIDLGKRVLRNVYLDPETVMTLGKDQKERERDGTNETVKERERVEAKDLFVDSLKVQVSVSSSSPKASSTASTAVAAKKGERKGETKKREGEREGEGEGEGVHKLVMTNSEGEVQVFPHMSLTIGEGGEGERVLFEEDVTVEAHHFTVSQSLSLPYLMSGEKEKEKEREGVMLLALSHETGEVHTISHSLSLEEIRVRERLVLDVPLSLSSSLSTTDNADDTHSLSPLQFKSPSPSFSSSNKKRESKSKGLVFQNALLGVDSHGNVLPLSLESLEESREREGEQTQVLALDAYFKDLLVMDTLTVEREIESKSMDTERLFLGDRQVRREREKASTRGGKGESVVEGNILTVAKNGEVLVSKQAYLDLEDGSLSINSIQPIDAKKNPLSLSHTAITHSDISSTTITSSPSITSSQLTVEEFADLRGHVVVGGSLTVHGSVVGSGPYVDSSDETLKENVHNVTHALDTVMQMRAVTYTYKTSEYPDMHFPESEQIGFIAQEVEQVLPQVVVTDAQTGKKAVAYAHTCALTVAALQELKASHDAELKALKQEHEKKIDSLTKEMAELKAMMKQLLLNKQ